MTLQDFAMIGLVNRILTLLGYHRSIQKLLDAIEIGVELDRSQPVVQEALLWLHHHHLALNTRDLVPFTGALRFLLPLSFRSASTHNHTLVRNKLCVPPPPPQPQQE